MAALQSLLSIIAAEDQVQRPEANGQWRRHSCPAAEHPKRLQRVTDNNVTWSSGQPALHRRDCGSEGPELASDRRKPGPGLLPSSPSNTPRRLRFPVASPRPNPFPHQQSQGRTLRKEASSDRMALNVHLSFSFFISIFMRLFPNPMFLKVPHLISQRHEARVPLFHNTEMCPYESWRSNIIKMLGQVGAVV